MFCFFRPPASILRLRLRAWQGVCRLCGTNPGTPPFFVPRGSPPHDVPRSDDSNRGANSVQRFKKEKGDPSFCDCWAELLFQHISLDVSTILLASCGL